MFSEVGGSRVGYGMTGGMDLRPFQALTLAKFRS